MFGEDGKVVVGGSDHGVVYVFDRRTGSQLDILHHANAGLVQTIVVSGYTNKFLLRKKLTTPRPITPMVSAR